MCVTVLVCCYLSVIYKVFSISWSLYCSLYFGEIDGVSLAIHPREGEAEKVEVLQPQTQVADGSWHPAPLPLQRSHQSARGAEAPGRGGVLELGETAQETRMQGSPRTWTVTDVCLDSSLMFHFLKRQGLGTEGFVRPSEQGGLEEASQHCQQQPRRVGRPAGGGGPRHCFDLDGEFLTAALRK